MGIKYIDDQLGGNVAVKHEATTFPARGTLAIDGDNVDVTDTGTLIQVQVHPEHRVDTVADLRAHAGATGERASLADPGGGEFERIASGTDDGGTVFVATGYGTAGAAWKRIYSGPLDVRWFGADPTGMNDSSTALQRAIDVSVEGDCIYFPKGTYHIDTPPVLKCNLWLKGDGQAQISGVADPATTIVDVSDGSEPFLDFRKDAADVYSITNTTNANPIVVTTLERHRLKDNYSVTIAGVTGNTNANGLHIATRIDEHNFSINAIGNGLHGGTATATSPVLPQSRGCLIENIFFYFPTPDKTNYSIQVGDEIPGVGGTAGIRFRNCHFQGPLSSTGDPTSVVGTDPGMIRLGKYEGFSAIDCTFSGGTHQVSCLDTSSSGPCLFERCWFYDCNAISVNYDGNGPHDQHYIACNWDPLYRTTDVGAHLNLLTNGFIVRGCGFFGTRETQPTGAAIVCQGSGVIEDCNIVTTSVGIASTSCYLRMGGNVIHAYAGINVHGGGLTFSGINRFVPDFVPDSALSGTGSVYPFDYKRAIILNEPYSGPCVVSGVPQAIESVSVGPLTIEEATNASPSVIKETAHGLTDGDWVLIVGATGNTNINGIRYVDVTDADHYTLKTAAGVAVNGNGVYDADSADVYHRWFFYESYRVGGEPGMKLGTATAAQQFTSGRLEYTRNFDASTPDGGTTVPNPFWAAMVKPEVTDPFTFSLGSGAALRHPYMAPSIITNEGNNGDITWTLPPIHPSSEYWFLKKYDNANSARASTITIAGNGRTTRSINSTQTATSGEVQVNTTAAHGYLTGDRVNVTGADDANADGWWYITKVDSDSFILNGSSAGTPGGANGTVTCQDYFHVPGATGPVTSVTNADDFEFNSLVKIRAQYVHWTPTGEEFLRWMIEGNDSWVAGDSSSQLMPLSGKRGANLDLGDASAHTIVTLSVPVDQEIYVSALFEFRKNDGTYWHAKRGAFFQRLSGVLTIDGTVDVLGVDHPGTPPAGWVATIDSSGTDIRFRATAEDNVNVQVTVQWDRHV